MQLRRWSRWITASLASAMLVSAAGAGAQGIDTPAPATPDDLPQVTTPEVPVPQGIESIEVTGERELTSVQDQANAVTRFDMGELDKLNITNVDGLASNVPGLHVGQQGQAAIITLRGVGTENASLTGESGVQFHVDGINYGRPTAARVAFFDIEMIDVKRGPQGLLGGKNSTSGSIMVNTRSPEMGEYGVESDYLMGNYDRQRARGAINVPLGEYMAARMALFWEQRDGYLDVWGVDPDPSVFGYKNKPRDASNSHDAFDADNFGLRGKLRFQPDDAFDMVVGYHWFKEEGNGPQADLVPLESQRSFNICQNPDGTVDPPIAESFRSLMPKYAACNVAQNPVTYRPPRRPPPGYVSRAHFPAIEDTDPRKIFLDDPESLDQHDRYWGFSNNMNWDAPAIPLLGETHLKLIGGYQRTETNFDQDFDASSLVLFPLGSGGKVHEWSSELDWTGELFEALEWQSSLFFMHEKGDSFTINTSFGAGSGDPGSLTPPTPTAALLKTDQSVDNKSYGAALHGDYHLTDSLTFSLGGRWIKDKKTSFLSRQSGLTWEGCRPPGNNEPWKQYDDGTGRFVDPTLPTCKATFRGTMWGSRLEYRPLDDLMLYAGIDRGYKSGGFGLGGVGGYLPEKIWAYSLGTKSEFFDQRLQVNLEGFVYNYTDMQIALVDGTEIRTENSDARMYGIELETRASPIEGLNLRGVINFIHTETIDYFSLDPATVGDPFQTVRLDERDRAEEEGEIFADRTGCAGRRCGLIGTSGRLDGLDDYSGNQLSRSPEWKYTLSGEYEIPLGRFGVVIPHVQYSWQDDTYFRVFNRDFDLQEAFHKTDAKLMWESPEQRWTAEVFIENIENDAIKDFILIGSRIFSAPPLAWYGAPRFYGFRVGFKY